MPKTNHFMSQMVNIGAFLVLTMVFCLGIIPYAAQANNDPGALTSLQIERIQDVYSMNASSGTVTIKLVLTNPYGVKVPGITVQDVFRDIHNTVVHREPFDLGDILPYEEITMFYDLSVPPDAEAGRYEFQTVIYKANEVEPFTFFNGYMNILKFPVVQEIEGGLGIGNLFSRIFTSNVAKAAEVGPPVEYSNMTFFKRSMHELATDPFLLIILAISTSLAVIREIGRKRSNKGHITEIDTV